MKKTNIERMKTYIRSMVIWWNKYQRTNDLDDLDRLMDVVAFATALADRMHIIHEISETLRDHLLTTGHILYTMDGDEEDIELINSRLSEMKEAVKKDQKKLMEEETPAGAPDESSEREIPYPFS